MSQYKSGYKDIKSKYARLHKSCVFGNVLYDVQVSKTSGPFVHIPFVDGLVKVHRKVPKLPYICEATKSRGYFRQIVYDNPVVTSKISFSKRVVNSVSPTDLHKLRDGPSRFFSTYMERNFLSYSRSATNLEEGLWRLTSRLLKAGSPLWGREALHKCKDALYSAMRNYDPKIGYLQTKPMSWTFFKSHSPINHYSNRLLREIGKALRVCRRHIRQIDNPCAAKLY